MVGEQGERERKKRCRKRERERSVAMPLFGLDVMFELMFGLWGSSRHNATHAVLSRNDGELDRIYTVGTDTTSHSPISKLSCLAKKIKILESLANSQRITFIHFLDFKC